MEKSASNVQLPFLPLRGVVVYPQIVHPLFVAREKSIKALKAAMAADKKVVLAAQKQHSAWSVSISGRSISTRIFIALTS
jgi:ATP-dependent Lon protease